MMPFFLGLVVGCIFGFFLASLMVPTDQDDITLDEMFWIDEMDGDE